MQTKPNILMIQADQLSPQALKSFDSAGQTKTPHLDELAENLVVFTNAYCNNPRRKMMKNQILPTRVERRLDHTNR